MFKFELDSVLSLKEKLEDAKKRELGLANRHKEQLEFKKNTLIEEHQVVYSQIKTNSSKQVNIREVKVLNQYSTYVNQQIKQTEVRINNARKVVEKKRDELLSAVKERQILDNLKEIKLEQYREETKKIEQLLLDETVSYKYGVLKKGDE
ncbi:MAG: flagellar export protein FliJ [Clostridia bacterium]|jgi:flagellar FliJ protein|nr:flagellar export protein FliJ [Clostridia bacterium]